MEEFFNRGIAKVFESEAVAQLQAEFQLSFELIHQPLIDLHVDEQWLLRLRQGRRPILDMVLFPQPWKMAFRICPYRKNRVTVYQRLPPSMQNHYVFSVALGNEKTHAAIKTYGKPVDYTDAKVNMIRHAKLTLPESLLLAREIARITDSTNLPWLGTFVDWVRSNW